MDPPPPHGWQRVNEGLVGFFVLVATGDHLKIHRHDGDMTTTMTLKKTVSEWGDHPPKKKGKTAVPDWKKGHTGSISIDNPNGPGFARIWWRPEKNYWLPG